MRRTVVGVVIGFVLGVFGLSGRTEFVTHVIDGDTFIVETGEHIRALGFNAAEKGEPSYEKAKRMLRDHIEHRLVHLRCEGKDVFGRELCWVWR